MLMRVEAQEHIRLELEVGIVPEPASGAPGPELDYTLLPLAD